MTEKRYRLIHGREHQADYYQAPQGGGSAEILLPPREPSSHANVLLKQLDAIVETAKKRPTESRDPEATRETIAVQPQAEFHLEPGALGDARTGVRVIGETETGVVLIDATSPELPHLRKKIETYGESSKMTIKGARQHAPAVAPIAEIRLSTELDLVGPRLLAASIAPDSTQWFEVACRGGARAPEESDRSRRQVQRQSTKLGQGIPQDFLATEQIVFFVRLSLEQLRKLIAAVDCVQEFDLAPPEIRDWLLLNDQPVKKIRSFRLTPPASDAPAVVLLDTGIATGHPLLEKAILAAGSVVPPLDIVEDTHGHGTQMAGVALYGDQVGAAVEDDEATAQHWIHSIRLLAAPQQETAGDTQRAYWPKLTTDAVTCAETNDPISHRPRVFGIATSYRVTPIEPTFWSHALDRLAYNDGHGRLFCISIGNANAEDVGLIKGYPTLNLNQQVHEPAQSVNALTVGAFTTKTRMPPEAIYAEAVPVAPFGGISPHTSAGIVGGIGGPDVLMEGGNIAFDGQIPDNSVETLTTLTTGRAFLTKPLSRICASSEATAHACRLAAKIWSLEPELSPAAVRGLIVHASSWTPTMKQQFPNIDERLAICGLGVPDTDFASACTRERATLVFEDSMPNAVLLEEPKKTPPKTARGRATETKVKRIVKFFRVPVPESLLLEEPDRVVELRVTLSYLPEPNMFRRRVAHGLDLKWDMQGPNETDAAFVARVNKLSRSDNSDKPSGKPFDWKLKVKRRSRGTVQSDRWIGPASYLAGSKLIAVVPILGWWERRPALRDLSMPFALIVTVTAAGLDIYNPIRSVVEGVVEIG